jgi:hypothetical protein
MDIEEYARLVARMRAKQKEFFGGRKTAQTVGEAKDLERRVDRATAEILDPPRSLFGAADRPPG